MSYCDFTLESVRHQLGIKLRDQTLFTGIDDVVPSAWLRESLHRGTGLSIKTEKARSEFIVAPILLECLERFDGRIKLFSGWTLDVDTAKGLTGACDFILDLSLSRYVMQMPLMVIVQAKEHDIVQGIAECAAQMLGVRLYNETFGKKVPYLYGCVTNGDSWEFLKLNGTDLQRHPERIGINEVGRILWMLVRCLKDVDQQASDAA
jgi:hypothetical protein